MVTGSFFSWAPISDFIIISQGNCIPSLALLSALSRSGSNFALSDQTTEESPRFVSVSCCPDVFVWHQKNKNTSNKSQRCLIAQKKNYWKYCCMRCKRVYRQFSAPSAWFFVFHLCLENYFRGIPVACHGKKRVDL